MSVPVEEYDGGAEEDVRDAIRFMHSLQTALARAGYVPYKDVIYRADEWLAEEVYESRTR